jgi:hypothetical protein
MIMKKEYIKPEFQVVAIKTKRLLLSSTEEIKSKKYSEDMTDL